MAKKTKNKEDAPKKVVTKCDYLIDGRFDKTKWDKTLKYRGSSNQTVYHVNDGKFEVVED